MFDTIAEQRIERASLSSPCQGLGGCNPHRARAQQAEEHFVEVRDRLNELIKERDNLKNGNNQKEYKLLKEKQDNLEQEVIKLDAQLKQTELLVNAWENNPKQQAGVEGLGWFGKRWWNKAFSCDTYTDREKEWKEKVRPYEVWVGEVSTDIKNIRAQISPDNLQIQRNAIAKLEEQISQKKQLLDSYNKRIADARPSYQANKDAEKLALEREAQEEKAKAEAAKTAKEQSKQTQTIILVGAALVGGYLLFRRKSTTNVNA